MFRIVCGLLLATATGAQSNLPKFLWREPHPMTAQDWTCGPGGCDNTPAPPFKFKKEDRSGSTAKIELTDSRGREWSLKFGSEVIPECFGSRFLTAIGYLAEPTYFVDSGKIENTPKLYRARFFVRPDGTFHRARFELRGQPDLKFKSDQTWAWNDNPFRGTRELAGLKIVMMLLSNWDAKDARNPGDSNAGVFQLPDALGYSVFDWGASLGHWGGVLRRDQSDCSGYALDTPRFVKKLQGDRLEWSFEGKHAEDIKDVTVEDVRWLLPYLGRITREQLVAAFRASGATVRQAGCWTDSIQSRIQQLREVATN